MFKKTILSVFLFGTLIAYSQVGIGTTTPAPGSILDIESTDKGIMIPRVELTSRDNLLPITGAVETGLMVFNTNTVGTTGPNAVSPGFYYWDVANSLWMRVATGGAVTKDWTVTGNGDIDATDFIGTTNAEALRIRTSNIDAFEISGGDATARGKLRSFTSGTAALPVYSWNADPNTGMFTPAADNLAFSTNGAERMRVLDDAVVVNTPAPLIAGDRFTVQGEAGEYAIKGYSSTNGAGIYGENIGTGVGVLGNSTNIGVFGQSNSATSFGMFAVNTNASGTGFIVRGTNSTGTYLGSGTGIAANGVNGVFAYGRNATGTGLIGVGNNNATIWTLVNGSGIAGTGTTIGVFGRSTSTANVSKYGGYFTDGTSEASVGGSTWIPGPPGPGSFTSHKIIGNGVVSTLIDDSQGNTRILFAPESPEIVFQDYGVGQLVNGQARINLDPILKSALHIDENHPLKVFVTLEGECNGVYVTNKTNDGFTVKELQGGTSNVPFSWQIVANRADTKDASGNVISKHVGVRLPVGPKTLETVNLETKEFKQGDKELIKLKEQNLEKSKLNKQ